MTETQKTRLLIVDDETAQMQALRETLTDHGYEATGCTSGESALAALQVKSYDLLLVDLMMPGMDGIALLRSALPADPQLVAIIMTGAGTIATAVEALQAGAFDYILKPFKLSAILPVLARGLALRRLRLENATLERSVRERSAELEAANIELDAFTRSASHDLRTPLNAVIGYSTLLAAKYGSQWPAEAVKWLGYIEQAGNRMNRLIEDLLRLSRLGHQALNVEPVDVGALVRSVVDELRLGQAERRLDVRFVELPQVMADASLLRQVFVNLLSNACKFTCRTQLPLIEVGCASEGTERAFYVRDNGAGFDMAHAARLFQAFERLHSVADFEGTGVGLTIVHRIVQRHGGRIWAEGDPGRGAVFRFTLAGAV
jgi:signal transduction histidine kinase